MIYFAAFLTNIMFGRGAVVAQLTVNQLVAGSNPAARANQVRAMTKPRKGFFLYLRITAK